MAANDGSGLGAVGAAVADLVDEMGQLGVEEIILRHRGAGVIGVSIRYNLHPACGSCGAEVGEGPGGDEPRASCDCGGCVTCLADRFQEVAAGGLAPRSGLMASAGVVH